MTQPFDHTYEAKNLRKLDKEKGEFWVGNPWLFPKSGENLSAYERNGIYLNGGDQVFHDIFCPRMLSASQLMNYFPN